MVFATIYRERSITRAAEALHVSQPAVSASVAKLREIYQDPLFVRSRQGVTPTNLSRSLIGPITESLALLDKTMLEATGFDPATSQRTISFSVGDLAEVLFLTPLVHTIQALGSGITVHNQQVLDQEIHDKLVSGELDFAIEYFQIDESMLGRQLLLSDDFVCVVNSSNPCLEQEWDLECYLAQDHLLVSTRPHGAGYVDTVLEQQGLSRRILVRVQHCLVAEPMVLQNQVCLTVPRKLVDCCMDASQLTILPVPFEMPQLELWLYWHQNSESSAAHQWVRELITRPAP